MDKEINKNIGNLLNSVEYLIEFLEKQQIDKDNSKENLSSLEISQDIKGFEKYLKSIENNTSQLKGINQSLNSFFSNLDTLTPKIEENEDFQSNLDLEQRQFIEIQNDIKSLVSKIDDLTNSLDNIGVSLDIDINPQNLELIKEKLAEIDFEPEISFDHVLDQIDLVKENLDSLQNYKFENVDFKILDTDNIENLINDLDKLKNIPIAFKAEDLTTLTQVQGVLTQIQELDLSNIDNLSNLGDLISIKDIDLTSISKVMDQMGELKGKIENVKKEIVTLQDSFLQLDLNPNLEFNIDSTKIRADFQNELNTLDVTIKPNIDLTELDKMIEKEYTVSVKPILKINDADLNYRVEPLSTVNVKENEKNVDNRLIEQFQDNTKVLQNLVSILSKPSSVIENNNTNIINTETEKGKSIGQVSTVSNSVDSNQVLIQALTTLIDRTNLIHLELVKSRFNDK